MRYSAERRPIAARKLLAPAASPSSPGGHHMSKQPELDPQTDSTDPDEREAQTFPRLTYEQAARAASFGTQEDLPIGALIFERGQRSVDFFLVLDGEIEVFDQGDDCQPQVFVVLTERQFTGGDQPFQRAPSCSSALERDPPAAWCASNARIFAAFWRRRPTLAKSSLRAFIPAPRRTHPPHARGCVADRAGPWGRRYKNSALPYSQRLSPSHARYRVGPRRRWLYRLLRA